MGWPLTAWMSATASARLKFLIATGVVTLRSVANLVKFAGVFVV
jgi:hypothetical protein